MSDHEREQVEWVFGLTGGDLMDEPWLPLDDDGRVWTFTYWYEFPPEYAERDFNIGRHDYRTVVRDIMFGPPPEVLTEGSNRWKKVATFTSSGEVGCPGQDDDAGNVVQVAHCADGDECALCGEKLGEPHSYIYLGDGWAEIVYQHVETCVLCLGPNRAEATAEIVDNVVEGPDGGDYELDDPGHSSIGLKLCVDHALYAGEVGYTLNPL